MDKKLVSKYITWLLALAAVAFAVAGWYYTGGSQKVEGFFGGSQKVEGFFGGANKESMGDTTGAAGDAGSCSVGTCG